MVDSTGSQQAATAGPIVAELAAFAESTDKGFPMVSPSPWLPEVLLTGSPDFEVGFQLAIK